MELGTGSMYGDESPTARGALWGKKKPSTPAAPEITPEDEEDLDEDLARQMAELAKGEEPAGEPTESNPEPVIEPPPQETPEPEPTVELVSGPVEEDDDIVSLGSDEDEFDSFLSLTAPDVGQSEEEVPKPAQAEKKESKRPIPEEDPDVDAFLDEDEFSDFLGVI